MGSKPLNKLPSQLSNEELISSLHNTEKKEEESIIDYSNDVVPFLTKFGIQSGAHPVLKSVLYNLYKRISTDPVNRKAFGREVGKFIFTRQIGKKDYYLINESISIISKKSFKLIKKSSRPRIKSPAYQKHFESFLKHYDIKKGKYYVPFYALYYLYDKWCHSIGRKSPLGYKSLHDFFTIYFSHKRIGSSNVKMFGLSHQLKKWISEAEINDIKEAQKKQRTIKN